MVVGSPNTETTTENDAFSKGTDGLTNDFWTTAANNTDTVSAKKDLSLTQLKRDVHAYNEKERHIMAQEV